MWRRPCASAPARPATTPSDKDMSTDPLGRTGSRSIPLPCREPARRLQTYEGQGSKMADAKHVVKKIKDDEIKFVELRFTDPRGKMQHITMDSKLMDEEAFTDGIMFDGSSIAGWKVINESDMKLMPDPSSAVLDPFFAMNTLAIFCDVLEPLTNEPYERDPRSIAGKAQNYLKQTGVGDTAVFGPEAEFFVFDDIKFNTDPYNMGFKIDSAEFRSNSATA